MLPIDFARPFLTLASKGFGTMGNFSLPEHMIAWSEEQVALGRFASVGTYLAQLIMEDRRRQQALAHRQSAVADGRASGISMSDPDSLLARWLTDRVAPQRTQMRDAIHEGRASGNSLASLDGILARALLPRVAFAA
jgi:Arc/MetJ-type ribon-helix-helix transcriptional regulator